MQEKGREAGGSRAGPHPEACPFLPACERLVRGAGCVHDSVSAPGRLSLRAQPLGAVNTPTWTPLAATVALQGHPGLLGRVFIRGHFYLGEEGPRHQLIID